MGQNVQSLSEISPRTTPSLAGTERQPALAIGPTGLVHKGGVPWHKRLALTKAPSPTAHHVLLVLGSFMSDGQSEAWPSVATLASMTGLSHRGVQTALRALEDDHLVQTETVSGRSSRYRLASTPAGGAPLPPQEVHPPPAGGAPLPPQEVHPPPAGGAPEVLSEVVSTRKAAAASISIPDTKKAETAKPARHTCPKCGNDWPVSFGVTCFKCQRKVGSRHPAGQAAPEPGKYDDLWDDTAPRPDPPPMKPELKRDLEADALRAGYRKVGGLWTMAW